MHLIFCYFFTVKKTENKTNWANFTLQLWTVRSGMLHASSVGASVLAGLVAVVDSRGGKNSVCKQPPVNRQTIQIDSSRFRLRVFRLQGFTKVTIVWWLQVWKSWDFSARFLRKCWHLPESRLFIHLRECWDFFLGFFAVHVHDGVHHGELDFLLPLLHSLLEGRLEQGGTGRQLELVGCNELQICRIFWVKLFNFYTP